MDITEQVTIDSVDYFRVQFSNYNNNGEVDDFGLLRTTGEALYAYDPDGPDVMQFQAAAVGTTWTEFEPDHDGDWTVYEIVEVGEVTVPYGYFEESYTRRAYQCFDPNDLSLGQTPSWYETIVPGVGHVREVDYWNDDPPMTMSLVAVIPEPATVTLLAVGGVAMVRRGR